MIRIVIRSLVWCIDLLWNISFLIIYTTFVPIINIKKYRRSVRGLKPRLVWGPIPLINNKYWSNALRKYGYRSTTIVKNYYSVFKRDDFDLYYADIIPKILKISRISSKNLGLFVFLYVIRNYEILHHPFTGGFLGDSWLWRWEAEFIRWARCKSVIIPFGSDVHRYSRMRNPSYVVALLSDYHVLSKQERRIENRVRYWSEKGDVVITARMFPDGFGRTDALPFSMITIDTSLWNKKVNFSSNDGENGVVKVIHTPNHRACKGTEFLLDTIKELRSEGVLVELILLEGVSNAEVRSIMREEADILAEQFINVGYALSGIEAMACGLPVLANLEDDEPYTRVFRRYSYLNECPIFSTTPETLKENLRVLIKNPKLREQLGLAGRKYVKKYHSEETAQYMFSAIYDKIWYESDIDLMALFHPLKSEYNHRKSFVKHPLVENRLPSSYFDRG